jgi:KDO2-lipid IV(A) lauroyltransferase
MAPILYFLFILPISKLPFSVLYSISNVLYFIIYKVIKYRTTVVSRNLRNSFPEKSSQELKEIEEKFYRHLCDLMVESIKLFTISEDDLKRRIVCTNPEIVLEMHKKYKHVMGLTCHYNNWEWLATMVGHHTPYHAIGIYQPLTNPFFENKMRQSRGKMGTDLVGVKKAKDAMITSIEKGNKIFVCTIIDQTPSNPEKCYWTNFLNQDTAVHLGMDKYAREFNIPIIFAVVKKVKRGFYEIKFDVLEENPVATKLGEIAEKYTRKTEEIVIKQPEFWLWTHKRWKHKRPANLQNN